MEPFLYRNPVFSLQEMRAALGPETSAYKRLRYIEKTGKVASVVRTVYAVVPPGQSPEDVQPDPFLVLKALRPSAIFCGHSALDLQGVANSVWNAVTAYASGPANTFSAGRITYRFIALPKSLEITKQFRTLVDRSGKLLEVTSPELTLVEGFRYPHRVGGIEELVKSADGFRKLDLGEIRDLLTSVNQRKLNAAVGWFLSRDPDKWGADSRYLQDFRARIPAGPVYLERGASSSLLVRAWNLLVPRELITTEGMDNTNKF